MAEPCHAGRQRYARACGEPAWQGWGLRGSDGLALRTFRFSPKMPWETWCAPQQHGAVFGELPPSSVPLRFLCPVRARHSREEPSQELDLSCSPLQALSGQERNLEPGRGGRGVGTQTRQGYFPCPWRSEAGKTYK